MLMGNFGITLLNTDRDDNVSDFYDILYLNFFAPDILQLNKVGKKNSKTLIDNIF